MFTRRMFVAAGAAASLSVCVRPAEPPVAPEPAAVLPPLPAFYGALTDEPYPVPAVPEGVVPPHLWRQEVENPFPNESKGTIIVDPDAGFLHLVQSRETAMRYGAGTGCAFHGRWASIPREGGHSFHGILGSHSTRRWAAGLTGGFIESGLG